MRTARLLLALLTTAAAACSAGPSGPSPRALALPAQRSRTVESRPDRSAGDVARPSGAGPTAEDMRTFDEVNRMRAQHGLRPLRWDDRLFVAARDHSREQRDHGYMGHGSPDPRRDALRDRLAIADCARARKWAEVVAWGYEGPNSVVLGWMNSSGHRHILLDGELTDAAFSRVGDYFTGDFATPLSR